MFVHRNRKIHLNLFTTESRNVHTKTHKTHKIKKNPNFWVLVIDELDLDVSRLHFNAYKLYSSTCSLSLLRNSMKYTAIWNIHTLLFTTKLMSSVNAMIFKARQNIRPLIFISFCQVVKQPSDIITPTNRRFTYRILLWKC